MCSRFINLAILFQGKSDDNSDAYHVSASFNSCTNMTVAKKVKWDGNGSEFILVDTPGM